MTRKTANIDQHLELDGHDISYIFRFVIEHSCTDTDRFEYSGLVQEETFRCYVIEGVKDAEFQELSWYKEFFENRITSIPVTQADGPSDLVIFNKFAIIPIKDRADYLKFYDAGALLFEFGSIRKSGNKYFLPLTYWKKFLGIDDYDILSRVYQFEICSNGLINFTNYFDPVGYMDGNFIFFEKAKCLNTISCN